MVDPAFCRGSSFAELCPAVCDARLARADCGATEGGYDHICNVWDVRSKAATLSLDHGAPIEALCYFPSGEACSSPAMDHSPAMIYSRVRKDARILQTLAEQ